MSEISDKGIDINFGLGWIAVAVSGHPPTYTSLRTKRTTRTLAIDVFHPALLAGINDPSDSIQSCAFKGTKRPRLLLLPLRELLSALLAGVDDPRDSARNVGAVERAILLLSLIIGTRQKFLVALATPFRGNWVSVVVSSSLEGLATRKCAEKPDTPFPAGTLGPMFSSAIVTDVGRDLVRPRPPLRALNRAILSSGAAEEVASALPTLPHFPTRPNLAIPLIAPHGTEALFLAAARRKLIITCLAKPHLMPQP